MLLMKCGESGTLIHYWWKPKNGTTTLEEFGSFYETKHIITIWPSNASLNIYLREMKNHVYTKICT